MAGYPFSGKTYVLNKLLKVCDIHVINLDQYKPDDYSNLSSEEKKEVDIAGWKLSLDDLKIALVNKKLVAYDTCCSSFLNMLDYFILAKELGHEIIYVFIKTPLSICKKRAGDKWISKELEIKYKYNFKESLPNFSRLSNRVIIIDNSNEPEIKQLIRVINND